MRKIIDMKRKIMITTLLGFLSIAVRTEAQTSLPSSPPPFYPPTPSGTLPYTPIPPQQPPQTTPSGPLVPSKETKEKGVVNPRTGEYYPGTFGGVVNPKTGVVLPKVEGGYINPQTGEVIPKKE